MNRQTLGWVDAIPFCWVSFLTPIYEYWCRLLFNWRYSTKIPYY